MSTFLDAAYQVLDDADYPMSAEEITRFAIDQGLLITRGATPTATMSASLYMDIKEKGATSKFIQVGPNQFALKDHSTLQSLPAFKMPVKKQRPQNRISKTKTVVSEVSCTHKRLDQEISSIQAFLNGISEHPPTSEKICDWVTLCYSLDLYTEGGELFSYVDPIEVNEWYYERTKKMARLCILHRSDQRG